MTILFVAPYEGAWIETSKQVQFDYEKASHPMWVRGLILTICQGVRCGRKVAPYVGAWIETFSATFKELITLSHPMWVRGLKLIVSSVLTFTSTSHPMWVRGLKLGCLK